MLTVAAVLKGGGREYKPAHAAALARQVADRLALPHRFVLLTDMLEQPSGPAPQHQLRQVQRLEHEDWTGWWAKLELFKPGRFDGPVLYFDLDTVIIGDLEPIAEGATCGLTLLLEDFYRKLHWASGVMAWTGDALAGAYKRFTVDPAGYMREFAVTGDQAFIEDCIKLGFVEPMRFWQDVLPGKIVSYKAHVKPAGAIPADARAVCFHGQPRPWQVTLPARARHAANDAGAHGDVPCS